VLTSQLKNVDVDDTDS